MKALAAVAAAVVFLLSGSAITTGFSADVSGVMSASAAQVCASGTATISHGHSGLISPIVCHNDTGTTRDIVLTVSSGPAADPATLDVIIDGRAHAESLGTEPASFDLGLVGPGRTTVGVVWLQRTGTVGTVAATYAVSLGSH